MQVLLNIKSGLPNGYWVTVRKYFAYTRMYNMTLQHEQTVDIRCRNGAYVFCNIRSIISKMYNKSIGIAQFALTNQRREGNDVIYTFKAFWGIFEVDFLIYI